MAAVPKNNADNTDKSVAIEKRFFIKEIFFQSVAVVLVAVYDLVGVLILSALAVAVFAFAVAVRLLLLLLLLLAVGGLVLSLILLLLLLVSFAAVADDRALSEGALEGPTREEAFAAFAAS